MRSRAIGELLGGAIESDAVSDALTGREGQRFPKSGSDLANAGRPRVEGKFLYAGRRKLEVCGVTYGTFAGPDGSEYPEPDLAAEDLAAMAAAGINAVRTYTVPPRWLLDIAAGEGLYVLVGLPWEQHVTFLDSRRRMRSIEERVRDGVARCAGHPAVLGYSVGNEIPAEIARWHGRRKLERFVERLYRAAKEEDPGGLVTYVNYPTTEYLELPFLDFASFNVYLEGRATLEAYLARLQNLVGDRPLVMAEVGLDSRRNGLDAQASTLKWQIETTFAAGCAGAFVFSWTDEWHRGGHDVDDWDFGLVDRERRPKPALATVAEAFATGLPAPEETPRVSVVVCTYNGERWLPGCLAALAAVDYPDFEVIVVNDGSTDASEAIARSHGVEVVTTENHGLSAARNTGAARATGEIIAYIDDDARPERDWLRHLALHFTRTDHVAVGGPNLPPRDDGLIADCVANAPGGPIHVLVSDREAEHLPGCNLAVRRAALEEVGGFDPRFRIAGDDVDFCWRLHEAGGTLGFNPGAVVWHHRRNSVRAYLRQQHEYGKAEGLLERKWPERYNRAGHLAWAGRVYSGAGVRDRSAKRSKVGYGTWGTRLFQSVYQPAPGLVAALPMMPEWYLVVAALGGIAALGALWTPLLAALPVLAVAAGAPVVSAAVAARRASFTSTRAGGLTRRRLQMLAFFMHVSQPLVRLVGRLRMGLAPWRRRRLASMAIPWPRAAAIWTERWHASTERLVRTEDQLRARGAVAVRGTDFDRWDIEVRGGLLGFARLRLAVEEHGGGRQLARYRIWPKPSRAGSAVAVLLALLAAGAAGGGVGHAGAALSAAALIVAIATARDCATAVGVLTESVEASAFRENDVVVALNGHRPAGRGGTTDRQPAPRRDSAARATRT